MRLSGWITHGHTRDSVKYVIYYVCLARKLYLKLSVVFNTTCLMIQDVYQISCICQHTCVEDNEVLRFQRISANHFIVKNQIKSVLATHPV